jgi:hypothetical protein
MERSYLDGAWSFSSRKIVAIERRIEFEIKIMLLLLSRFRCFELEVWQGGERDSAMVPVRVPRLWRAVSRQLHDLSH